MSLLTTNWQPMDPAGALAAYTSGVKLGQADNAAAMEAQQQAQAMIAKAQQQKELEARTQANYALQLLQEQRLQHAADLQEDFNSRRLTATEAAAKARQDQIASDNAPYVDRYQGGAVASKPAGATDGGVDLFNAGNPVSPAEGLLNLNATGYHPYDVKTAAERKMEGAPVDAKGHPIHTLESFQRGESPYVTVAVPQGSDLFGKVLSSPQAPGVVFKADDHFGSLDGKKISGPRIDIATDTRDAASKLTGPMSFTLGGTVPPAPATRPAPPEVAAEAPAGQTIMRPTMSDEQGQDMAMQLLSQRLAQAGVPVKEAKKQLAQAAERMATAKASISKGQPVHFPDGSLRERNPDGSWAVIGEKPESTKPIVRNFADGTTREYDATTGEWTVAASKPVKDTSEEDTRKREDQIMQKINLERVKANDISRQLQALTKQGKSPSWPWKEGGKYYKTNEDGVTVQIDEDGYKAEFKKAQNTDWADLNDQRAKREARIADYAKQLDSVGAPAAEPAPEPPPAVTATPAPQDMKALAMKALNDPNASPAHKAAARKILGI